MSIHEAIKSKYNANGMLEIPEFSDKRRLSFMKYTELDKCTRNNAIEHYKKMSSTDNMYIDILKSTLQDIGSSYDTDVQISGLQYDILIHSSKTLIKVYDRYQWNAEWCKSTGYGTQSRVYYDHYMNAVNNGMRCIQLYDWEDVSKIAMNICYEGSISGNQYLEEISDIEFKTFQLINNPTYTGSCSGNAYGIFIDDKLVTCMRLSGISESATQYISDFCTDSRYDFVLEPDTINRLMDISDTNSLGCSIDFMKHDPRYLEQMGMIQTSRNQSEIMWINGNDIITYSRFYGKSYEELTGKKIRDGMSKRSAMIEDGWVPVYTCGNLIYKATKGGQDSAVH